MYVRCTIIWRAHKTREAVKCTSNFEGKIFGQLFNQYFLKNKRYVRHSKLGNKLFDYQFESTDA